MPNETRRRTVTQDSAMSNDAIEAARQVLRSSRRGGVVSSDFFAMPSGWGDSPMETEAVSEPMPEPMLDFDECDERVSVSENERIEQVNASDFAPFELPRWNRNERENAVNTWFRTMEYRVRWIFYREEREGVNRQRYINPFSPEDFSNRLAKVGKAHPMDNGEVKFYDWHIGGTDFIMRLESFRIKHTPVLRCHFIYKPDNKQLSYSDRAWDGCQYRELNMVWAEVD